MSTSNSIIHYYESVEGEDTIQDRENRLRDILDAELSEDLRNLEPRITAMPGELRLPIILFIFSLLFSIFSLVFSIRTYNVRMETLFFQPNSLFNTEALLIEALRKRTDLEISKRDQLIAEYQRRMTIREEVVQTSPPTTNMANVYLEAPIVDTSQGVLAELESMNQNLAMENLYAQRLERALIQVSRRLMEEDLMGAEDALTGLRQSLGGSEHLKSPMAINALSLASALESNIAVLRRTSETPVSVVEPTYIKVADPETLQALERVREENIALLDRILDLEARRDSLVESPVAPPVVVPVPTIEPIPAPAPAGAFLGTIAVAAGDLVLVDLAQGAQVELGAGVEIYGMDTKGRLILRTEGVVQTVRSDTAELRISVGDQTWMKPLIQDTVYIKP